MPLYDNDAPFTAAELLVLRRRYDTRQQIKVKGLRGSRVTRKPAVGDQLSDEEAEQKLGKDWFTVLNDGIWDEATRENKLVHNWNDRFHHKR